MYIKLMKFVVLGVLSSKQITWYYSNDLYLMIFKEIMKN